MSLLAGCSCHVNARGERETTVACRVHHIMPDGCIAADHEVACDGCREFVCDHDCAWYDEIDPDVPEDEREESFLCAECGAAGVANGVRRLKP